MVRSRTTRLTALTLANVLLPVAVLVFAIGFFPFKPLLPGLAIFADVQEEGTLGHGQPEAVFDRVVFMVVDALRTDFVYGHDSGFGFTQRYGRKGAYDGRSESNTLSASSALARPYPSQPMRLLLP